ncbi:hypothetical protein [Pseudomonas guariconensis]|uniref:hypothetical protein n=1 Tax=Pseudomonas guariconensis TaxID=1288410 RepID=UPI003905D164
MSERSQFRAYFNDRIESTRALFRPDPSKQHTPCKLETSLIRDIEANHSNLQALYAELDTLGPGMIVQNGSGDSWALILPDASEPGRFRYSVFRNIGWMSHYTTDTLDEAVLEAYRAGFTRLAPRDTLDKLSTTSEWKKGCERLVYIDAHNRGALSYSEMIAEFEKIEAKFN